MKSKKLLPAALVLIVIAAGAFFFLEKRGITHFYGVGKNPVETTDGRGVNDVDYSPATTTDNEDIEAKKESGEIANNPAAPTKDTAITISFIASAQDSSQGPLVIRALLGGVTDGTCTLTLDQNGAMTTKSAPVQQQNTTFGCAGFDVPFTEIKTGEVKIRLSVETKDGRINEATASAQIF